MAHREMERQEHDLAMKIQKMREEKGEEAFAKHVAEAAKGLGGMKPFFTCWYQNLLVSKLVGISPLKHDIKTCWYFSFLC